MREDEEERLELLSRLAQVQESALEDVIGAIDVHALILGRGQTGIQAFS